jgi:hypothetical protein
MQAASPAIEEGKAKEHSHEVERPELKEHLLQSSPAQ